MKIDIICNDGSPLGVTLDDLWGMGNRGIGIGGSEYALLTVCEGLASRGHKVTLYNDPSKANGSPFEQKTLNEYDPYAADRDILITFRSPNSRSIVSTGKRVWWSCDQYTVGSFKDFAGHMEKIVCISPFHAAYFMATYQIGNAVVIDIPVRIHDFSEIEEQKIAGRCIFTSVPDRGLHILHGIWPQIKSQVPNASLVITSDYRLWGTDSRNEIHRIKWMDIPDVEFLGAVPRSSLIVEQAKAQMLVYPCVYDELFCVSVAEAQCLGVYPVTSNFGALVTTNMGIIVEGDPETSRIAYSSIFANAVVEHLKDQSSWLKKAVEVTWKARDRFNLDRILDQWENEVFG